VVIEPPYLHPPVTPLSMPVTEPRPVPDPVPDPLLLLPSLLKPVLAGALLPNVPDVLASPGAAAATPDTGRARPQRTAGRAEPAQRDRGVLRPRERGRGGAHRQDGRRRGTPSKIRQLYTKHSISMW
jgi:hypothetical protein